MGSSSLSFVLFRDAELRLRGPCYCSPGNVSAGAGSNTPGSPIRISTARADQSDSCIEAAVGDRRVELIYANKMEIQKARGHADRFHSGNSRTDCQLGGSVFAPSGKLIHASLNQ